eukprot:364911-Chlamydomonas_euryale.AAC.5
MRRRDLAPAGQQQPPPPQQVRRTSDAAAAPQTAGAGVCREIPEARLQAQVRVGRGGTGATPAATRAIRLLLKASGLGFQAPGNNRSSMTEHTVPRHHRSTEMGAPPPRCA